MEKKRIISAKMKFCMHKQMKNRIKLKYIINLCSGFVLIIGLIISLTSCEDDNYDIEFQEGYPNVLAGNWEAIEFQNATVVNDRITYADNVSDYFDMVTALDPNSNDSLVIGNIYDSNIRVKVYYENDKFEVIKGKQLEVINYGRYGIYYVSVNGNYNNDEESGEYLTMHIGLYDEYSALFDTMYVVAFRKTGFEDTDYRSLLSN
jgi:hypothetical protein